MLSLKDDTTKPTATLPVDFRSKLLQGSPSNIISDYLSLFGAQHLQSGLGFQAHAGSQRDCDAHIASVGFSRICENENSQSFLEIGCGRSYPQSSKDQGVPHLSRRLVEFASSMGKDFSLRCSDLLGPDEKVVFFLDRNGGLSSYGNTIVSSRLPISIFKQGGRSLEPLSKIDAEDSDIFIARRQTEELLKTKFEKIFVRPALDPELEERLYGINCDHRVDYRNLRQYQPNQFDFVYSRYLNPSSVEALGALDDLKSAVARVSNDSGQAIIHIDGNELLQGAKIAGKMFWSDETSLYKAT